MLKKRTLKKIRHVDPDPGWIKMRTWIAVGTASVLAVLLVAALILFGCPWSIALPVAVPIWAVWFYWNLPRWPDNWVHCSIGWLNGLVRFYEHLKSPRKAEDAERVNIPRPDLLRVGGALMTATSAKTRSR